MSIGNMEVKPEFLTELFPYKHPVSQEESSKRNRQLINLHIYTSSTFKQAVLGCLRTSGRYRKLCNDLTPVLTPRINRNTHFCHSYLFFSELLQRPDEQIGGVLNLRPKQGWAVMKEHTHTHTSFFAIDLPENWLIYLPDIMIRKRNPIKVCHKHSWKPWNAYFCRWSLVLTWDVLWGKPRLVRAAGTWGTIRLCQNLI